MGKLEKSTARPVVQEGDFKLIIQALITNISSVFTKIRTTAIHGMVLF